MDNFLKGLVHEFCPKIKTFFYQRFTQDLYQKKSFFDILKRKQSFLDLKNLSFKKGQKWSLSKGVSPWILSKNRNFSYHRF